MRSRHQCFTVRLSSVQIGDTFPRQRQQQSRSQMCLLRRRNPRKGRLLPCMWKTDKRTDCSNNSRHYRCHTASNTCTAGITAAAIHPLSDPATKTRSAKVENDTHHCRPAGNVSHRHYRNAYHHSDEPRRQIRERTGERQHQFSHGTDP